MKKIIALTLFFVLTIACQKKAKKEYYSNDDIETLDHIDTKKEILTTAKAIAIANGFNYWEKITEIKFTFNVDQDSTHYEQSWQWKPKENEIILISNTDTISYNRTQIDSTSLAADQKFINDTYWLLVPLNLIWDATCYTSQHEMKAIAPISNTEMQKLTIVYKNEGGYTPGDAYDFYFEGDFKIKEWVFRKKNNKEPSLITQWNDHEIFDGIRIAKTHYRNEGNWKLYFTDIQTITE